MCSSDVDLGSVRIPKGSLVIIPIYAIHHHPDFWPNPEKFDPNRFVTKQDSFVFKKCCIPDKNQDPFNCLQIPLSATPNQSGMRFLKYFRFTATAKSERDPLVHIPFGAGPRHCIGSRLSLLEIKVALVQLLHHFVLEPSTTTQVRSFLNNFCRCLHRFQAKWPCEQIFENRLHVSPSIENAPPPPKTCK